MADAERQRRVAVVTGASAAVGAEIANRLESAGFVVVRLEDWDVAERGRAADAIKRVEAELGSPSVLVTAPSLHDAAPFGEMSAERWQRLLRAHLGSTINACAAAVPGMVESGAGTVVTTSSWLAFAGVAKEAYFAAATGSVLAFTKSFALEVARHGVRVNCVAVGPLDRGVTPADVADSVMFLVDDGDFFVGQVLTPAAGAVV